MKRRGVGIGRLRFLAAGSASHSATEDVYIYTYIRSWVISLCRQIRGMGTNSTLSMLPLFPFFRSPRPPDN